jgi:hypothetical protein
MTEMKSFFLRTFNFDFHIFFFFFVSLDQSSVLVFTSKVNSSKS